MNNRKTYGVSLNAASPHDVPLIEWIEKTGLSTSDALRKALEHVVRCGNGVDRDDVLLREIRDLKRELRQGAIRVSYQETDQGEEMTEAEMVKKELIDGGMTEEAFKILTETTLRPGMRLE